MHLATALIFEYPRARETPGSRLMKDRGIRHWLTPVTPYLYLLKKPLGSNGRMVRPPFKEMRHDMLGGGYGNGFLPW